MSVVIRLSRAGRRHLPFYHIGVFDRRTRRDGKPIEQIGFYDPLHEKTALRIDEERVKYWLSQGARPSDTVQTLLKKAGLSSSLWTKKKKKSSEKTKKDSAGSGAEAQKKAASPKTTRSVKKRKKPRTANSKMRAERAKKK